MYPQQQVQNKPTGAYVISLLGGIIGLLAALFIMVVWGILAWVTSAAYYDYGFDLSGYFLIYTVLGVWMLITSILLIVFARRLNSNPMEHTKYGWYIIILSILGIGGLLGLIGGILALVYKPIPVGGPQYAPQQQYYGPSQQQPQQWAQPQQQYAQPQQAQQITRICPQCGRVVQENLKFCPNCGKQLN